MSKKCLENAFLAVFSTVVMHFDLSLINWKEEQYLAKSTVLPSEDISRIIFKRVNTN